MPHEKFHTASYGVKILFTISNVILAHLSVFLKIKTRESEDSVSVGHKIRFIFLYNFSTKHFSFR